MHTKCSFEASARPFLIFLFETTQEFTNFKTNTMVNKALNGLTPEYLSGLFIRKSESHLRALGNSSTDLQLLDNTPVCTKML